MKSLRDRISELEQRVQGIEASGPCQCAAPRFAICRGRAVVCDVCGGGINGAGMIVATVLVPHLPEDETTDGAAIVQRVVEGGKRQARR